MGKGATKQNHAWRPTAESLQLRNGSVELTPGGMPDAKFLKRAYKVRLFDCTPRGLIVEQPNLSDAGEFETGSIVTLLIADGPTRWLLSCKVLGETRHELNDRVAVPSYQLSSPVDVKSAQRRNHFRASVAAVELPPVMMTPWTPDEDSPEAGLDLRVGRPVPFKGKLLNIGGGGIGLEVPQKVSAQIRHVRHYTCSIALPTCDDPLVVDGGVAHLCLNPNGTHYLGFKFEFKDPLARRRIEDHIVRFTTWCQRQQLQRKSQKG